MSDQYEARARGELYLMYVSIESRLSVERMNAARLWMAGNEALDAVNAALSSGGTPEW